MREILPLLFALTTVIFTALVAKFAAVSVAIALGLSITAGLAVYIAVTVFLDRTGRSSRGGK